MQDLIKYVRKRNISGSQKYIINRYITLEIFVLSNESFIRLYRVFKNSVHANSLKYFITKILLFLSGATALRDV